MSEYYARIFNVAKYLTPPMKPKEVLSFLKQHSDPIIPNAVNIWRIEDANSFLILLEELSGSYVPGGHRRKTLQSLF